MGDVLRVAVWCAVSSLAQGAEDRVSLPEQEAAGREFAGSLNGAVVRVYYTEHSREVLDYSEAAELMESYRQLDEDCQRQVFDVLWCRSRDRLGRTLSLIAATEGRVQRAGAEVYSAAMPHQIGRSTGDANSLMAALESWQAQREISELRRRSKSGIRGRIKRGLPGRTWPYGYVPIRDANGRSVGAEFDDTIGAVQLATDLFLRGEPYRAIARALNESPWDPPRASRWRFGRVHHMLMCDVYAGYVHWGGSKSSEPSEKFPALWDEEIFRAIQAERRAREEHARRRGETSPLNGVAYCLRCGKPMNRFYFSWPHIERGVRCSTHAGRLDSGGRCHANHIRESDVLDFLHEYLASLVDPARFDEALAAHQPGADLQRQIEDARHRVGEIEEQRMRLGLGFAAGTVKDAVYQVADQKLEDDLAKAAGYVAELERRQASQPSREERASSLRAVLDRLDALFAQPSGELAAALRRIGLRIWVEESAIRRVELA